MMKQWLIRVVQMIWQVLQNPRNWSLWWRRIRRGCGIILLLFLLLSCLSCILLGVLVGRATATGPDAGLDVLLVVDNSNSMFDKGGIGSDPDLRRIEAAQMFVNYLGVDSGPISHRLGVIFFGGQAQLVVPLTPLADQARRAEIAALFAEPQRMDWTDPATALTLARDTLLAETDDGHQPVVVLLTDGKPEWDNNPTEAERQSVIEELRRIGRQYASDGSRLFVILLSNEATDADSEIGTTYVPLWEELVEATEGCFYAVRRADDLITAYHDILVLLSGMQTAGPVVEAEIEGETQVEAVTIEPNLARVTFVVRVSGAGATVTVHRPDGGALKPEDDNVRHASQGTTAIWAIERPRPGDWAVVMAGQGSVTVWKDYLPAPVTPTPSPVPTMRAEPQSEAVTPSPTPAPQMIVDEWPEAVLEGQPVTLSVAFEPEPPESPRVWAEWVLEDGQLQGWVWMAGVGLSLAGLGGWELHRWFGRLPCVAGRLRVLQAPAGYAGPTITDLSLLDRRSVRLGGAQAELPVPAEGSSWAIIGALSDGSGMELTPYDGQVVQINEHPLVGPHLLSDGDRIATEGVRLRYERLHYGL